MCITWMFLQPAGSSILATRINTVTEKQYSAGKISSSETSMIDVVWAAWMFRLTFFKG